MPVLPQPSTPRKSRSRIVSIQVCRGLAAVVVVLAHLHNVESKYFPTHLMRGFQYGVIGVDIFFVISGVVISAVTAGKFGSARNAVVFLYHRLARIFPVYWIYSAIVLAAFLYNPLWINATAGHHADILASFLLLPTGHPMLILQAWTLSFELYFYLVFFVVMLLPRRLVPWGLALWAAFVLLWTFAFSSPDPLVGLVTSPSIFEFLAGCVLFQLYRRASLHPIAGVLLLLAAIAEFAVLVFLTHHAHANNQEWIEYSPTLRPALYGSVATLLLYGAMELERSSLVRYARPLEAIGDWSYSIYLSHIIVIELVGRTFARFLPRLPLAILGVDVLSLILVLAVSYVSYTWIERPLTTLLYRPTAAPVPLRST